MFSHFSHVWLFMTLWTVACQAPLSMGFSRQEYWRGFLCPPPGIFPTQGSNPSLLHSRRILYCLATGEAPRLTLVMLLLSFSRVGLFETPWTAACHASLSCTVSWSLLKLMSIESVMPSHPLSSPSPAFNLFQHQDLFQWVSSSHQVVKVLEFQLQHQSFQWIFRTDFL